MDRQVTTKPTEPVGQANSLASEIPLRLSAYQQDALAELATHCAAIAYHWREHNRQPTEEQLERFTDTIDRFDRINWGDLYDRLHRTGANARA